MSERTVYWRRCGWCGAYEGEVDPREPCARDVATGDYIGPHQFGPLEPVARPIADPRDDPSMWDACHRCGESVLLHAGMVRCPNPDCRAIVADVPRPGHTEDEHG